MTTHSASLPLPRGPLVTEGYFTDVPATDCATLVRPPSESSHTLGGVPCVHLVRVRAGNVNGWGSFSPFFALP